MDSPVFLTLTAFNITYGKTDAIKKRPIISWNEISYIEINNENGCRL